jgi:hypothetical protein
MNRIISETLNLILPEHYDLHYEKQIKIICYVFTVLSIYRRKKLLWFHMNVIIKLNVIIKKKLNYINTMIHKYRFYNSYL